MQGVTGVTTAKPHILYLTQAGSIHDERFLIKLRDLGYPLTAVSLARSGNLSVDGIKVHRLGVPTRGGAVGTLGRFAFSAIAVVRLKRLIARSKPDIVHSGFVTTAGFVAALSGFRPHLSMPWGSDILLQPQESRLRKIIARFSLKRADLVTCDAETVKSRILELAPRNPEDITVFPWGIDLELFRPDSARRDETRHRLDLDDDTEVLITTRFLGPLYGIDDFLRALPAVFRTRPNATALIIGDGPQRSELESLANSLGIERRVRFLGFIANPDLPAYLNAADLYVSPSHSDGTSISLLEAMGCGLPVVVTDIESIREWVVENENGLLTPIGDPDRLATAMVKALSDKTMLNRAATNNLRQVISRANWDTNFAKLEAIYQQLMHLNQ